MTVADSRTCVVSTAVFIVIASASSISLSFEADTDLSWVPKGAIAIRHGKGMLGPPLGTFLGRLLHLPFEDIPHAGMYLGDNRTYDLRIVDEKMRGLFGLDKKQYPNGESVIFQAIPDDAYAQHGYDFKGRFKNVGWFSVVESGGFVRFRGQIMPMYKLPPDVKHAIVERVCEKAQKEVGPIEPAKDGGRTATPGKSYGTYSGTKAHCLHPILRFYDEALVESGVTPLIYTGPKLPNIPGGFVPTTLTKLLSPLGILDPSQANDFLHRCAGNRKKLRILFEAPKPRMTVEMLLSE